MFCLHSFCIKEHSFYTVRADTATRGQRFPLLPPMFIFSKSVMPRISEKANKILLLLISLSLAVTLSQVVMIVLSQIVTIHVAG